MFNSVLLRESVGRYFFRTYLLTLLPLGFVIIFRARRWFDSGFLRGVAVFCFLHFCSCPITIGYFRDFPHDVVTHRLNTEGSRTFLDGSRQFHLRCPAINHLGYYYNPGLVEESGSAEPGNLEFGVGRTWHSLILPFLANLCSFWRCSSLYG